MYTNIESWLKGKLAFCCMEPNCAQMYVLEICFSTRNSFYLKHSHTTIHLYFARLFERSQDADLAGFPREGILRRASLQLPQIVAPMLLPFSFDVQNCTCRTLARAKELRWETPQSIALFNLSLPHTDYFQKASSITHPPSCSTPSTLLFTSPLPLFLTYLSKLSTNCCHT